MKYKKSLLISIFFVPSIIISAQNSIIGNFKDSLDKVVIVNRNDNGRVFEGIGALSAGASSRLLIDYPEPQRKQILDYLFKPNFGASLHQLKVEIGGEVNSTCGTEPAYARTREEFNNPTPQYFQRGYEWWLMEEAKKRNPAVQLDILQWGTPPWIGEEEAKNVDPVRKAQGARDFTTDPEGKVVIRKSLGNREFRFFSQDNANYIANFILGAKKYHNLDINFCGIWNEITYETAWIKQLRRTLNQKGLDSVKIVAADIAAGHKWQIADDILEDPELAKAIYAIGAHYPKYKSTPSAITTGKPLYSSEEGSLRGGEWGSAGKYAQIFNRNYIQGKMTKTIFWSMIAAYYEFLDYADCGPMRAITPWSGFYEVEPAIWAVAHTTQFAQPGWRYLDQACAITPDNVSYVTLLSPNQLDFSVVIESFDAKHTQRLVFKLDPQLSAKSIALWRSTKDQQFQRLADLPRNGNTISLEVQPDAIYTLTTTRGQQKGSSVIPAANDFPLPYTDDFEAVKIGRLPKYFSDQEGAFEVARRPDSRGKCLFQAVTQKGIPWLRGFYQPYTLIGSSMFKDYEVSCQVRIVKNGCAAIGGRIKSSMAEKIPGYWLEVNSNNHWTLKVLELTADANKYKTRQTERILAEGDVPFAADAWHSLALRFTGSHIVVNVDGNQLTDVTDETYTNGPCGIMSGWNQAYFDNFSIKP